MSNSTHDIPITTDSSIASEPNETGKIGNFRWVICGLLFFATMINYMDRQIIGILKHDLSIQLSWKDSDYANIVSAFQLAYAFGYLFAGRFMDRFGVKWGFPIVAFLWSVAAAAHGAVRSLNGFIVARLGLGLTEGGNFPAAIKTVSEWFPQKERSLATGLFNSASNIGAIICPLAVPWLAAKFGWPAAFYITGGLGFFWVAAWAWLYAPLEKHPRLSAAERQYIEEGRPAVAVDAVKIEPVGWGALLSYRATWAYLLASILAGPVWWFYLFWLPDFLQKGYHLNSVESGYRVSLVYAMAIVGSVGGGWLATYFIKRGMSVNAARKLSLGICAVAVVPVGFVSLLTNSWMTAALVGVAAAAHQGWSANLYTFVSDTMPKRAVSSLVGLGGFVSGIASMGNAQAVAAVLKSTGSYAPIFVWASSMYVLSLLCVHLLVPKIASSTEE